VSDKGLQLILQGTFSTLWNFNVHYGRFEAGFQRFTVLLYSLFPVALQ